MLTDAHEASLDGVVDAQHFALNCTPAVNLFPAARRPHPPLRGDPRVPRGPRPHAADGLRGPLGARGGRLRLQRRASSSRFIPFYAWNDQAAARRAPAYYTVQRAAARALDATTRPRRTLQLRGERGLPLSGRRRRRARTSHNLRQLSVETSARTATCRCSSRWGKGGPTSPSTRARRSNRCVAWRGRARRARRMPTATWPGA